MFEPPKPEVSQAVRRQILDAGFEEHELPQGWLDVTIAAMTKWMQTTPQGAKFAIETLRLECNEGVPDKEYKIGTEVIPPDSIYFFHGAMVRGTLVQTRHVEVLQKENEVCEMCHITAHCAKEVLDPYTNRLIKMCNYCVSFHEHPRVADQGNYRICTECPKLSCGYNPNKLRRTG